MQRAKTLSRACLFVSVLALAAGAATSRSAHAQGYPYQCPPGYYFDPNYGCVPLSYFYGPPTYVYPGFSFGFFYGGHWDHWHGHHPGGAPPRGGPPHGGGGSRGGHH